MSQVRENLMNREGYSPYCGSTDCMFLMPRTSWDGEQFKCRCGWRSQFPADFIAEYKAKWHPEPVQEPAKRRSPISAAALALALSAPYRVPGPGPGRVRTYRSDFYAPPAEQQRRDQAAKDKRDARRLRNIKNEAARLAGQQVAP